MLSSRRSLKCVVFAALLLAMPLVGSSPRGQTVIFIDDDAVLGGDGSSWGVAYKFLQDALANAVAGTEIRVAQGTYKPDQDEAGNVTPGDREAAFQLINGVALMGGFAGIGALNPDVRNIELFETILSGDLLGNDGPLFKNNHDNSYHVLIGNGTDETALLDGFMITAGNADGPSPFPRSRGGGIYIRSGNPMLRYCTFRANRSAFDGGAGAILFSNPTLTNCYFIDNTSAYGGGLTNCGSSAVLIACEFDGNTAELGGGGMYSEGDGSPMLIDCTFLSNSALGLGPFSGGGGMHNNYGAAPTLSGCTFTANFALLGGAMINRDGAGLGSPNPTIFGCAFNGNSASGGGALYNRDSSSPIVTESTFCDNVASLYGGGMLNESGSSPTVTNCTFTGNSAIYGGGMNNTGSSPTVFNSAFTANEASFGAGLRNGDGSSPMVSGCLFENNIASVGGGGMYVENESGPIVIGCTFRGNSALGSGAGSGGGALHNNYGATPTINGCTFVGNFALRGGGITNRDDFGTAPSNLGLANCLLAGNWASEVGGGIYNHDGSAKLVNCTLSGNGGGGLVVRMPGAVTVTSCTVWGNGQTQIGGIAIVKYSCIEGGWDGPGSNIIDADPLFVDPANGDFRLKPGSPCIDAGDNTAVPQDITIDLDGNPRFVDDPCVYDTGNSDGINPIVDIGAYEFQDASAIADLNLDGVVGMADLRILLAFWGPCGGICLGDLDCDGIVAVPDLLTLLANWAP